MLNFDERSLKLNKKINVGLEIDLIKPFSNRILNSTRKSCNSGVKSDTKMNNQVNKQISRC